MPPRPRAYIPKLPLLDRVGNPAIIPIPAPATGNNVPFSLKKTRRTWHANTKRVSLPVTFLADAEERSWIAHEDAYATGRERVALPMLQKVKMNARDIRSVQKAGGVEGMLLSRPSKHFTPFGRQLRNDLFNQLHRLREEMQRIEETPAVEAGAEAEVHLIEGERK
ncbi:hypothetical protein Q8F55_002279 [Vanrija albida]|uniref:MRPL25 domain-containing protein n=1 Tax=Vanrija albida TaxID=181172 RepID=A0ABR3Q9H5_9TREE